MLQVWGEQTSFSTHIRAPPVTQLQLLTDKKRWLSIECFSSGSCSAAPGTAQRRTMRTDGSGSCSRTCPLPARRRARRAFAAGDADGEGESPVQTASGETSPKETMAAGASSTPVVATPARCAGRSPQMCSRTLHCLVGATTHAPFSAGSGNLSGGMCCYGAAAPCSARMNAIDGWLPTREANAPVRAQRLW